MGFKRLGGQVTKQPGGNAFHIIWEDRNPGNKVSGTYRWNQRMKPPWPQRGNKLGNWTERQTGTGGEAVPTNHCTTHSPKTTCFLSFIFRSFAFLFVTSVCVRGESGQERRKWTHQILPPSESYSIQEHRVSSFKPHCLSEFHAVWNELLQRASTFSTVLKAINLTYGTQRTVIRLGH